MLNELQKQMIQAIVIDELDDIVSSLPDLPAHKDIILRMEALQCLTMPTLQSQIQVYKDANIWSETVRRIYEHKDPEGRCENYPYFGNPPLPSLVVYKGEDGKPEYEPMGLLGLTARNDDTTPPVTRDDVIKYIEELIKERISRLNEILQKLPKPAVKEEPPVTEQEKKQQQDKFFESMFVMFQSEGMIGGLAKGIKPIDFEIGDLDQPNLSIIK